VQILVSQGGFLLADRGPAEPGDEALKRLAETMRRFRNAETLSLHGLSYKSSVDRKVLRGLENARLNPSIRTLEKIAEALGISIATLLGAPASGNSSSPLDVRTLIALNVKRLRHSRNWSAADVEDRVMMKAAYVSFIETGRRGCTLQTLLRLAEGFKVDVLELIVPPPSRSVDGSGQTPLLPDGS
jgi:transcriptional regulator with XRE-family HTH domain